MVGNMPGKEACPLLPRLDEMLSNTVEPSIVIQTGSSSGREIAWLAQRNPNHKYIGTDIYPDVIARSSQHHNLPNLTFERYSAQKIYELLSIYKNHKIVVFSSGSLQYVQPEHLKIFFQSLRKLNTVEILLEEPGNELKRNPTELEGSLWRGNFSYAHNYKLYAENAGLTTVESKSIDPYGDDFPEHMGTIHYYYHGKTSPR